MQPLSSKDKFRLVLNGFKFILCFVYMWRKDWQGWEIPAALAMVLWFYSFFIVFTHFDNQIED